MFWQLKHFNEIEENLCYRNDKMKVMRDSIKKFDRKRVRFQGVGVKSVRMVLLNL